MALLITLFSIPFNIMTLVALAESIGILFFTLVEEWIRYLWLKYIRRRTQVERKRPTKNLKSWQAKLWSRFGLLGVALLTPPILSPPIGVTIAVAFGTSTKKVLLYMIPSVILWGFVFGFFGKYYRYFDFF